MQVAAGYEHELLLRSFMMLPGARVARMIRSKRLDGFELPEEAWRLAA